MSTSVFNCLAIACFLVTVVSSLPQHRKIITRSLLPGSPPSPAISYSNLEYSIETTITPVFSTLGKQFRVVTNDTVVLPCEVVNAGNYVLAWKKGIAILTAGGTKVTPDKRIRLVDGYNLEIRDIQTKDAGNYVCHIATMEPREITHTVEILVPPRMSYGKEPREVDVKKGTSTTLDCKAEGNPVPKITWTRVNNILPSGEKSIESPTLSIELANRHHAGLYKCTASNGVGTPASSEINVKVLFPPEIELERAWVHSGEGYEAQLVCIVDAQPAAEVSFLTFCYLRVEREKKRKQLEKGKGRNTQLTAQH
ncbi:lachesin-like [Diaphorina citri]|uniref:Lachesin-like n=1 Tax=Diaphorina citri TaxID=121845 RepID=A0A3Q0IZL7_DIACI|nr:lachesin-like [Diaphorina citri]